MTPYESDIIIRHDDVTPWCDNCDEEADGVVLLFERNICGKCLLAALAALAERLGVK